MSLESWKEEFYSIPAYTEMTELEAVEHSIRKWTGLRTANLEKHELKADWDFACVEEPHNEWSDKLWISDGTCALCHQFKDDISDCRRCLLRRFLGNRCDLGGDDGEFDNRPYSLWRENGDPEPMIAALEATRQALLDGTLPEPVVEVHEEAVKNIWPDESDEFPF